MYIYQPRMANAYTLHSQCCFIIYMDPTLLWSYETLQTNKETEDDDDWAMQAVARQLPPPTQLWQLLPSATNSYLTKAATTYPTTAAATS